MVDHAGLKPRRSAVEIPLGLGANPLRNLADDEQSCTSEVAPLIRLRSPGGDRTRNISLGGCSESRSANTLARAC
jgi:hypothetical protein